MILCKEPRTLTSSSGCAALQIKLNKIKSYQINSNQTKLNQIQSNQDPNCSANMHWCNYA